MTTTDIGKHTTYIQIGIMQERMSRRLIRSWYYAILLNSNSALLAQTYFWMYHLGESASISCGADFAVAAAWLDESGAVLTSSSTLAILTFNPISETDHEAKYSYQLSLQFVSFTLVQEYTILTIGTLF